MAKGFKNEFIAIVLVVVVLLLGIVGYIYIVGGSGEASEPISAPTLVVQAADATEEVSTTGEALAEPTPLTETEATDAGVVEASATAQAILFRIASAESQASFTISEVLRGVPTTVVGVTDQVAGDIIINLAEPSRSELGMIRINARTLATDNELRNRAIRASILESARDEYEFIEFTPTSITALPEAAAEIGGTFSFQVTGDLQVRNIVNSVVFDVTATLVSAERLEGNAQTTVTREVYGLTIPNAPGVANVSEEVILAIEFVALATDS